MFPRLTFVAAAACALAAAPAFAAPSASRHSVLFIVADDMRWDISANTPGGALTPKIDKLAAGGVRFVQAYTQFPVCNPSRTWLCTGRYPTATGVVLNGTHSEACTEKRCPKNAAPRLDT